MSTCVLGAIQEGCQLVVVLQELQLAIPLRPELVALLLLADQLGAHAVPGLAGHGQLEQPLLLLREVVRVDRAPIRVAPILQLCLEGALQQRVLLSALQLLGVADLAQAEVAQEGLVGPLSPAASLL